MKKHLIFNWKNYLTPPEGDEIFSCLESASQSFEHHDVIVAPDALHLGRLASSDVSIALQDISAWEHHPHTWSLSIQQVPLATYVIVGHSERRRYDQESSDEIRAKIETVQDSDKDLIFCVGEIGKTYDYEEIKHDIHEQLQDLRWYPRKVLLCYEPSWAIGSGSLPSTDMIADIFSYIIEECGDLGVSEEQVSLIYWWSVSAENIKMILSIPKCEWAIIGTASVSLKSVQDILSVL